MEIILEVVVGTGAHTRFSSGVDVVERGGGVRTSSKTLSVMRIGVIRADQDTKPERSVGDIAHSLVAGHCAVSRRIIREMVDWAVGNTLVKIPVSIKVRV